MSSQEGICPVCGMEKNNRFILEHDSVSIVFCSEQCRERFLAHPQLYIENIKNRTENIKTRKFNLLVSHNMEELELLKFHVEKLMGIKNIECNADQLLITYDLLQVTDEHIVKAIDNAGSSLDDGWIACMRRSCYQEEEESELSDMETNTIDKSQ